MKILMTSMQDDTEGPQQKEPTLGSVARSKTRGSFGLIGIPGSALWKLPVQTFPQSRV